jgi:hypothetical protein
MRRRPLLILLAATVGCTDRPMSTEPVASHPSFVIADAASEYKPGFYWLPPMVRYPTIGNAFDGGLAPTVQICELAGDDCGAEIAVYTTEMGPGGEVVQVDAEGELSPRRSSATPMCSR